MNNKYICDKCIFTTNNKNKYERHLNTKKHQNIYSGYEKTNDGFYVCDKCSKKLSSLNGIYNHIKMCKNNINKKGVCFLISFINQYFSL